MTDLTFLQLPGCVAYDNTITINWFMAGLFIQKLNQHFAVNRTACSHADKINSFYSSLKSFMCSYFMYD